MRLILATVCAFAVAGSVHAADNPSLAAKKQLNGTYEFVHIVRNGQPDTTAGAVTTIRLRNGTIEGAFATTAPNATFDLDTTATPHHMDISAGNETVRGIYEVTKTEDASFLTVAFRRGANADRPTDFAGNHPDDVVYKFRKKVTFWSIITTLVDPRNLSDPAAFQAALNQPGVYLLALAAVTLIVFTETGLLIGFLLPGDSLLVVLGIVAQLSGWNLWPFIICLCVAAIVGDTVGYWIGWKTGPAIFSRPSSRFFKQEYLQKARAFYEKHGGKTIIIARFIPIVRTFVPVVAGAAKMDYRTFLFYNVFGGIGWIVSMVLFGYYLIPIADPPMRTLLGDPNFTWAKHIDKVVIVVVFLSVAPIAWKTLKHWLAVRKATKLTPPASAPPTA
jgi:membrane-associated protein